MAGIPFISVGFDSISNAEILQLANLATSVAASLSPALFKIGDLVTKDMVANTWVEFENPTGQLADSIIYFVTGPEEITVVVQEPYAWRMEAGFVGTDSLGRVYDEAGKPYAWPAVFDNEDQILQLMSNAVGQSLVFMQEGP